jgi:hypothetical protein
MQLASHDFAAEAGGDAAARVRALEAEVARLRALAAGGGGSGERDAAAVVVSSDEGELPSSSDDGPEEGEQRKRDRGTRKRTKKNDRPKAREARAKRDHSKPRREDSHSPGEERKRSKRHHEKGYRERTESRDKRGRGDKRRKRSQSPSSDDSRGRSASPQPHRQRSRDIDRSVTEAHRQRSRDVDRMEARPQARHGSGEDDARDPQSVDRRHENGRQAAQGAAARDEQSRGTGDAAATQLPQERVAEAAPIAPVSIFARLSGLTQPPGGEARVPSAQAGNQRGAAHHAAGDRVTHGAQLPQDQRQLQRRGRSDTRAHLGGTAGARCWQEPGRDAAAPRPRGEMSDEQKRRLQRFGP